MKTFVAVAGLLCVVLSAGVSAQRGRRGGGGNANAGLPVATNAILRNPTAYYGKQITVSAGVDRMLTKTAFLVDQWKMTGPKEVRPIGMPVLVIAPYLTNALDQRNYLIVRGELLRFDTAALARVASEYKLDLGPELWEEFQGQPILLAASVLNSTYTELSKKPILPPTANELALSEAMKTINPAFAALKTAVEGSNAGDVARNVAQLKPAFSRTEKIWDDVGQSSAGQWARDAQEFIGSIEHDAAGGDWDHVKFAAGKLNALCGSCHTTFRDRADDGTFRMKAGTF
jgi:cytochrome c556